MAKGFSGNLPLADLTRLVESMKADLFERDLRAVQRAALIQWRDLSGAPGLGYRFTKSAHAAYGFSNRSLRYQGRYAHNHAKNDDGKFIRKGDLPDYVYTGRFRDSLRNRKPKKGKSAYISTTLSIYGGALNVFGHQHGRLREVIASETKMVNKNAYTRRTRNGGSTHVRAYTQRAVVQTATITPAPQSYKDEWRIRPAETLWVQQRSDALFLARFKSMRLNRDGTLKDSARAEFRKAA